MGAGAGFGVVSLFELSVFELSLFESAPSVFDSDSWDLEFGF